MGRRLLRVALATASASFAVGGSAGELLLWGTDKVSAHLRSEPLASRLREAANDRLDVMTMAAEAEAQGVDGPALHAALAGASPCSVLRELAPELRLGDCVKVAAVLQASLQSFEAQPQQQPAPELTEYQKARRKKYADQATRPWYWPYESTFRNSVIYVLVFGIIYCVASEKWMQFKAWRRKQNKINCRKKNDDARGNGRREVPKPEVKCAADVKISEDKMRNLVHMVKEANRGTQGAADDGAASSAQVRARKVAGQQPGDEESLR